jgi:hypothetical protein
MKFIDKSILCQTFINFEAFYQFLGIFKNNGNQRIKMILRAMSRERVPPIGSVPMYEKSQRKSHITGKLYILLIILLY